MKDQIRKDLVSLFGEEADAIMADPRYTEWHKEDESR